MADRYYDRNRYFTGNLIPDIPDDRYETCEQFRSQKINVNNVFHIIINLGGKSSAPARAVAFFFEKQGGLYYEKKSTYHNLSRRFSCICIRRMRQQQHSRQCSCR
ncbi:hypothetical protein DXA60_05925 [Roseburia sp. OF03-24]|nr:hypothetical protein DXA60_05925 [Roseburia sp. OF03-24]